MTNNDELTFEKADLILDETIKKLETEKMPLRDSVECYKKACEMLCYCMEELNNCTSEVETINTKLEKLLTNDYGE